MLENPGFEDGFYHQDGQGELQIGNSWTAWYVEREGLHRPEYRKETRQTGRGRVYSGDSAQKMFTTFSKHDAGLWQAVEAVPTQWYKVSCWAYIWTSSQDDPDVSKDGKYVALIGANGWGAYPYHHATVWGEEGQHDHYNEWQQLVCYFQAYGDRITIFSRGLPEWPTKHNDLYLDGFSLEEITPPGAEIPEPPEPPPSGECKFFDPSPQILKAHALAYRHAADALEAEASIIEGLRNESFLARAKRWISGR